MPDFDALERIQREAALASVDGVEIQPADFAHDADECVRASCVRACACMRACDVPHLVPWPCEPAEEYAFRVVIFPRLVCE